MSTESRIAWQLAKTLENGRAGFEVAADRVASSGRTDIAERFREFARERSDMAAEIGAIAAAHGDDVEPRSTVPGALHRGWMGVKDALTGDDIVAVVAAAEQGEDHALEQYREALDSDVSSEFRPVLERQMSVVRQAHDYVRSLELAERRR